MKISYHASLLKISVLEFLITKLKETYEVLRIAETDNRQIEEVNSVEEEKNDESREIRIKMQGMAAIGQCFHSNLKGLAKLKAILARFRYQRIKFEKYL